MTVAKLSESKQMFWNASVLLRHNRLSLQHTLSLSVGISLQYPHTQNGALGCSTTSGAAGSCCSCSTKSFKANGLDLNSVFSNFTRISLSKPSIISYVSNKGIKNSYYFKHTNVSGPCMIDCPLL